MRRFEGQQQGETKRDEAVFTESAAVKVLYVSLRLSTPSPHNRAIESLVKKNYRILTSSDSSLLFASSLVVIGGIFTP
jgi:hypothetical protein